MYACPSTVKTKICVLFTGTATQSDICTASRAVSVLIRLPFAAVRFLHLDRNKWWVHHSRHLSGTKCCLCSQGAVCCTVLYRHRVHDTCRKTHDENNKVKDTSVYQTCESYHSSVQDYNNVLRLCYVMLTAEYDVFVSLHMGYAVITTTWHSSNTSWVSSKLAHASAAGTFRQNCLSNCLTASEIPCPTRLSDTRLRGAVSRWNQQSHSHTQLTPSLACCAVKRKQPGLKLLSAALSCYWCISKLDALFAGGVTILHIHDTIWLTSWWCVWAAAGLGPAPGPHCPAASSGQCQPADLWPRRPRPGWGTWRIPSAAAACWPGSPPSSDRWRPAPTVSSPPRESQTWLWEKTDR